MKGFRVFNSEEKNIYKDTKRHHLENQKMDKKQQAYWKRKPYDFGRRSHDS